MCGKRPIGNAAVAVKYRLLAAVVVSIGLYLPFHYFGGIGSMFTFGRMSFTGFATGLLIMIGGALAARIWCELLIVLFKIN